MEDSLILEATRWLDGVPRILWAYMTREGELKEGIAKTEEKAIDKAKHHGFRADMTSVKRKNYSINLTNEENIVAKKKPVSQKIAKKKPKPETKTNKLSVTGRVLQLLLEQVHTDEEMIQIMHKEYSDRTEKQIKVYISCQRCDLNAGRKLVGMVDPSKPLVRLFRVADNKLIPWKDRPQDTKKTASGTK